MRYENVRSGIFLSRPNRFIAMVDLDGETYPCHVKNTGRLSELLVKGTTVYVEEHDNPNRKTRFSLIAVMRDGSLYNIDSQAPNKVAKEWVEEGSFLSDVTLIKPEKTYKNSRFDLYIETKSEKIFMEVKGVTLNREGIGYFPDAPTERGKKHVLELIDAVKNGYRACVLFVVKFEEAKGFRPNRERQPDFADALLLAQKEGVQILAVYCHVKPDQLKIVSQIPVFL
ncbi:MAG: DNA/RNA nuclease SfsA [Lachnospiraceae bacterium]|nr:DNA/RNA nuclease SfsA [Lachnospiraceae bacterium]